MNGADSDFRVCAMQRVQGFKTSTIFELVAQAQQFAKFQKAKDIAISPQTIAPYFARHKHR